jgi:hypothetical protein
MVRVDGTNIRETAIHTTLLLPFVDDCLEASARPLQVNGRSHTSPTRLIPLQGFVSVLRIGPPSLVSPNGGGSSLWRSSRPRLGITTNPVQPAVLATLLVERRGWMLSATGWAPNGCVRRDAVCGWTAPPLLHSLRGQDSLPSRPLLDVPESHQQAPTERPSLRIEGRAAGARMHLEQHQLQPLVLPQPSQTKQDPAGRIFVPQVKHSGLSTAVPVIASISSAEVCAPLGAGFAAD